MRDRTATILFFIMLAGLSWLVIGQYRDAQAMESAAKVEYVQTTCDQAHAEISGNSEQACGDAQDQTGTEYLCDSQAVNASCWVEVK